MSGFAAVYEDEDDWLSGYLATTEYGTDARLNSNPKPKVVKKDKSKVNNLFNIGLLQGAARRNSWAAPEVKSGDPNSEVVGLPERVNAVRDSSSVTGGNMIVREHAKAEESKGEKRSSLEEDEEAWKDIETVKMRRQTLDYDELEAVKERVMQAATVWKRTESGPKTKPSGLSQAPQAQIAEAPADTKDATIQKSKSLKSSSSGRNWLVSKWLSKFGGSRQRTG